MPLGFTSILALSWLSPSSSFPHSSSLFLFHGLWPCPIRSALIPIRVALFPSPPFPPLSPSSILRPPHYCVTDRRQDASSQIRPQFPDGRQHNRIIDHHLWPHFKSLPIASWRRVIRKLPYVTSADFLYFFSPPLLLSTLSTFGNRFIKILAASLTLSAFLRAPYPLECALLTPTLTESFEKVDFNLAHILLNKENCQIFPGRSLCKCPSSSN